MLEILRILPEAEPTLSAGASQAECDVGMSTVIAVDLSRYFDTIRHSVLLDKTAKRVQDPQVMGLVPPHHSSPPYPGQHAQLLLVPRPAPCQHNWDTFRSLIRQQGGKDSPHEQKESS